MHKFLVLILGASVTQTTEYLPIGLLAQIAMELGGPRAQLECRERIHLRWNRLIQGWTLAQLAAQPRQTVRYLATPSNRGHVKAILRRRENALHTIGKATEVLMPVFRKKTCPSLPTRRSAPALTVF